jgi:primosomal protein N' (replication factor Y) (superfamily II helicase)
MTTDSAADPVANGEALCVEVAVPLPLPTPLTYRVPPAFEELAQSGARVRVPVGKRRLVGVILARCSKPPELRSLRDLEAVLDAEPVLTPDLLELAEFTARYYLAPPGEVLRAVLPAELPPWGQRKVWLTAAGALAPPRASPEAEVIDALRAGERLSLAELQGRTRLSRLAEVVAGLVAAGLLGAGSAERQSGARYRAAFELASGELPELLARAGRSAEGRRVLEHLAQLGRPATLEELESGAGVSDGVIRRLKKLGLVRSFTQVERLDLGRHVLGAHGVSAPFELRGDQEGALAAICAGIAAGKGEAFLLLGMTGAGKTEVYLRAAEAALAEERSVILLVPELALVPALARTVRERFGEHLALLHSGLGRNERQQEWERIRRGEARVVLGPRSAVFAPVPALGLIVVDEEQDTAYKQDTAPRYNGRDLALLRAQRAGCPAVLVSATPSLESRWNAERGRLVPLTLTVRAGQGRLPEGVLVDLRSEGILKKPGEAPFSKRLVEEMELSLAAGDQIILLRNRRGYAPMLLCRACGEDFRCDDCGLPRTLHRRDGALICHYCGSRAPVPPRCPKCAEPALEAMGAGTERVEETVRELFPQATIDVLDRDALRRPGGATAILERFGRGDVQVLVGTQMVSKGHHFPRVALTAVLAADTYLGFPDFRAVERTYSLLTQLAGRAGRGERPGKVVIQTFHPDHFAIRAALDQDDAAFAREEMRFRRVFHYPPFTRLVQILVRDTHRERARSTLEGVAERMREHPLRARVRLAGPAPAPFERLRNQWRFQLLVRGPSGSEVRRLVSECLPDKPASELAVDVDPYQLL